MANPEVQINFKKVNPSLSDLINLAMRQVMLDLNCHALGTVQSFNSETQSATIQINYKQTVLRRDANGNYKNVSLDYPPLLDVPVLIMGGGAAHLTFPITAGDGCLVLFNDRDIDNWIQSGQNLAPASARLHSVSDGIALVGLSNFNDPIENYDTLRAALFNGETKVAVGASLVLINNAAGKSLGQTLTDLTTALTSLTTLLTTTFASPTPTAGNPLNAAWAAAVTAVVTQINTAQAEITGLLE